MTKEIRNPKSEARRKSQIRIPKSEMRKDSCGGSAGLYLNPTVLGRTEVCLVNKGTYGCLSRSDCQRSRRQGWRLFRRNCGGACLRMA